MNNRIYSIIAFLLLVLSAHAQTLSVNTSLTTGLQSAPAITYAGGLHAVEGGAATYSVSFSALSGDTITSARLDYSFDGIGGTQNLTVADGKVTAIAPISHDNLSAGATAKRFNCTLTYACRREGRDTTLVLTADGTPVYVYERPRQTVKTPDNLIFCKNANVNWSVDATGGYRWTYKWQTSDGKSSTSSSLVYSGSNTGTVKKNIDVSVSMTNVAPDGVTVWASVPAVHYTVEIYPEAKVSLSPEENYSFKPEVLFQDQQWDLRIETSGGYDTGWTYVWKDEKGNVVGEGKTYSLKSERAKTSVSRQVSVTVTNQGIKTDGSKTSWYGSRTFTWYASFLPCPDINIVGGNGTTNMIYGDNIILSFTVKDDNGNSILDDASYNWTYYWTYNNSTYNNKYVNIYADNNYNREGIVHEVNLKVSGKLPNTDRPYTAVRTETLVFWPTPGITHAASSPSSYDACGGQTVPLQVETLGGVKNGWTYTWYRNGMPVHKTNDNIYAFEATNNSTDISYVTSDEYIVVAENFCNGISRYKGQLTYNLITYPKPRYSDKITLFDTNRGKVVEQGIREGNSMRLFIDECYGGYWTQYSDKWNFQWQENNSTLLSTSRTCFVDMQMQNRGYGRNQVNTTYSLRAYNSYKNGAIWAMLEPENYSQQVTIYRRPQTPKRLIKKGNGTSNTYIATVAPLNDSELMSYDYYMVFGYTDSRGNDHALQEVKQEEGTMRFATFPSSAYSDASNRFWVYTLWKYPDGPYITSGRCYVNSIDENWDGSAYTQAEISSRAIEGINDGIIDVHIDNDNAPQTIYNLNGAKVGKDQIKSGVYIVDGKKIFIK